MSENFAELFAQSNITKKMRPGTIVTATVLSINTDTVMVDAGLKSEGCIAAEEFYNESQEFDIAVGDTVEVALDVIDDGLGETRVSRRKAKQIASWACLEAAYENKEIVTGVIFERIRGGFAVDINEVRAFLPGSLVDVRAVRDVSNIEGKPIELKVIKIDRPRSNVVVSRRAVLEDQNEGERDALLDALKEGSVVKGIVKNLTDYGAFVDLGGVDGLLHITDIAWRRIKHPSEIVNVGDEIEVKILKHDRERHRVSLGLKQLAEDTWVKLARAYPEGTRLLGKVTNLTDYGCFVELEEGIEGLVYVSEMDWTNKNVHPSRLVHIGQEVEIMVLNIDEERRRISLGMKQCLPNPWEEFANTHKKDDQIQGQVKSITDFGIFVGLEGEIDGLIRLTDISWTEPAEEAVRAFNKGDTVDTVILAIDAERERISLGIKQLVNDPFADYIAAYPKGSVVSGTVQKIDAKQVYLHLADAVEGSVRRNEFTEDGDNKLSVQVNETLEAKITVIDRRKRMINLSVRRKESDDERAAVEEYGGDPEAKPGKTLGDLIKNVFKK